MRLRLFSGHEFDSWGERHEDAFVVITVLAVIALVSMSAAVLLMLLAA